MNKNSFSKGFTLIELIVVVAIIGILSGVILFSITQYVNKSKDSNIAANLAVLVPAGEVYYNMENAANGDGYNGFCTSSAAVNSKTQMPELPNGGTACGNNVGFCCAVESVNYQSWAACVQEYSDPLKAFCVDSRGVKKEIDSVDCISTITQCS